MPQTPWAFWVLFSRAANVLPGPPEAWPPWPDTSQLFSLERLPCPAPPGPKARARAGLTSCLRWPQKTLKDNFSLEQTNECIHLSFSPLTQPIYKLNLLLGLKWDKEEILGRGAGEAHLAPEILAPFLGASVQFHNTYTTNFQNWSCLVFWFFLCLCICALKVPSKWILIVGAARCCLLQCPQGPEDLLLKALIDKDLSVFRSSWSRGLAHQCNLNAASLAPRRMRVNVVKMKEDL